MAMAMPDAELLQDAAANKFTLSCHYLTKISLFRKGDNVREPISRNLNFTTRQEYKSLYRRRTTRTSEQVKRRPRTPDFIVDNDGFILTKESSGKDEFLFYLCFNHYCSLQPEYQAFYHQIRLHRYFSLLVGAFLINGCHRNIIPLVALFTCLCMP